MTFVDDQTAITIVLTVGKVRKNKTTGDDHRTSESLKKKNLKKLY